MSEFTKLLEKYEDSIGKDGVFESVTKLCDTFWAWRMVNWPEFASFCGCHDFDDRLNDNSLEAIKAKEEKAEEFLLHCNKLIEKGGLNEDDNFNVLLLREELRVFTGGAKHQGYLFPVCYMEGLHVDFEQITSWMQFKNADDFEKYMKRLESIPPRLVQDMDLMKEGIRLGKVFNHHSMRGVLEGTDRIINVQHPEHTVMYAPFKTLPDAMDEEEKTALRDRALEVIEKSIIPAFVKLRIFVENDYIPKCRASEGVTTMTDGEEFYKQCLKFHLSMEISAQAVHDLGRREVARIRQRMQEVIDKLGFQGEIRDFLQHLRTHQDFYHESQDELLEAYRDICYNKIRPKLGELFKKIPESKLIIEATPPSRAQGPAAYYLAGTLDGSRPGKYFVNVHNLKMSPKYKMVNLSLHEGEPGHHFQGMYAIEMKDAPEFRKNMEDMLYALSPSRFPINTAYVEEMYGSEMKDAPQFRLFTEYRLKCQIPSHFGIKTAFGEGWGLYCEYLGNELGLYDDDLYSLFGHLSDEMMRACRLVVDTGIHAFGWSYEKGVMLFQENCALCDEDIRNEVKRYITWPGQACGYKVGQLKIKELRERASKALGDKFDVREFHEAVLKCGSVPLTVLDSVVNRMIKETLDK